MQVRTRQFPILHQAALENEALRGATMRATENFNLRRDTAYAALENLQELRAYAAATKDHTLAHLDHYLGLLADKVEARGGRVHFAADAAEAREIIVGIAREAGARTAVKGKTMVSEEIALNEALEKAGVTPVETDLGEYILQMDGDAPSHIVGPAIHKPKSEVDALFNRLHGVPLGATAEELAAKAREVIREQFVRAEIGISGVNFAIAETGSIVLVENEGNIRLTTSLPRVHVALMGLEKVIPRIADLGVFLKLLPRAATGQAQSVFVSLISGPRQPDEMDGPEAFHLVVLDNGRSGLLADHDMRAALRCIRCGACLNTCPVYQQIGGHAYGWVYSGPIGSVLDPNLLGLKEAKSLPFASSLCGACGDVCPVKIPLPQMLVTLRSRAVERRLTPRLEVSGMRAYRRIVTHPAAYRLISRTARLAPWKKAQGKMPSFIVGPLGAWQLNRHFPAPAPRTFREVWNAELAHETSDPVGSRPVVTRQDAKGGDDDVR